MDTDNSSYTDPAPDIEDVSSGHVNTSAVSEAPRTPALDLASPKDQSSSPQITTSTSQPTSSTCQQEEDQDVQAASSRLSTLQLKKRKRSENPAPLHVTPNTTKGKTEETTVDAVHAAGRSIIDLLPDKSKYSTNPVMLPPMPNQKHIDPFTEGDLTTKAFKKIEDQQRTYEAECVLYKVLAQLNVYEDDVIVLHNLEYTKQQAGLFVPDSKEGEHDFVVLIKGVAVVALEVKAPLCEGKNRSNVFKRNLSSATEQLDRMESLIQGIAANCSLDCPVVFKFSVLPSISRETAAEFDDYKKKDARSVERIMFKDDLQQFHMWWEKNITEKLPDHSTKTSYTKLETTLLGLWGIDKAGKFDSNKCTLVHWISETNDKLKQSILTNNKDGNPNTKSVLRASKRNKLNIFSEYIDIKYLNKEQDEIFHQKENILFLSGPAGSGKTILIQGKIIELVKVSDTTKPIVVFLPNSATIEQYKLLLAERADISVSVLVFSPELVTAVKQATSRVILVAHMNARESLQFGHVLQALHSAGYHIFLDDLQSWLWDAVRQDYLDNVDRAGTIVNALCNILDSTPATYSIVWIVSDIAQSEYYYSTSSKKLLYKLCSLLSQLPNKKTLSHNHRNSVEIVQLLSCIRMFVNSVYSDTQDISHILPIQRHGHRIHGTIPCVYFVDEQDKSSLQEVLSNKVGELLNTKPRLQYKDLAVIKYNAFYDSTIESALHQCNIPFSTPTSRDASRRNADNTDTTDNVVWLGDVEYTSSQEWPAVIAVVLAGLWYSVGTEENTVQFLTAAYLALSRARVHLTLVVVCTDERRVGTKYLHDLLKPHVIVKGDVVF